MHEEERLSLLAHCASLTLNALRLARDSRVGAQSHAYILAENLRLDMAAYWQPTAQNYFGRISKERILEAAREGVSEQPAQSIDHLKKQEMAEAAERLLKGMGWLPSMLRTPDRASFQDRRARRPPCVKTSIKRHRPDRRWG